MKTSYIHKTKPAGNIKFTLVDVLDIGEVAARVIVDISKHINKTYELTSSEKLSFKEMADELSEVLEKNIQYISPNLLNFFIAKRREKTPVMLILVMIMLHYLPRFQKESELTNIVQKILGKQPITFKQFIVANQNILLNQ